jgi:hypothetical protein
MNLLESQRILFVSLKIFGFFPWDFRGKYKRVKNHLYNFVVTITLIATFAMYGAFQVDLILQNTTEKNSALGHVTALIEIFSSIFCFAIIKVYLLIYGGVLEKYFDSVRDLEISMRNFHSGKSGKVDRIIKDLGKSTLMEQILVFAYYISIQIGFCLITISDNLLVYLFDDFLYSSFNFFFVEILIFLKMNMNFARRLQNHINQVLMDLQKSQKALDVDDFIKIHNKIKHYLVVLNEVFGFIFLMTLVAIFGSVIPETYKSIETLAQSNFEFPRNRLSYIVLCMIWAMFSYYYFGRFALECDKSEAEVAFRKF